MAQQLRKGEPHHSRALWPTLAMRPASVSQAVARWEGRYPSSAFLFVSGGAGPKVGQSLPLFCVRKPLRRTSEESFRRKKELLADFLIGRRGRRSCASFEMRTEHAGRAPPENQRGTPFRPGGSMPLCAEGHNAADTRLEATSRHEVARFGRISTTPESCERRDGSRHCLGLRKSRQHRQPTQNNADQMKWATWLDEARTCSRRAALIAGWECSHRCGPRPNGPRAAHGPCLPRGPVEREAPSGCGSPPGTL